jgi:uncharacterized protein (TIGR02599 family)
MELIQPAEDLGVYDKSWYAGGKFTEAPRTTEWIQRALGKSSGATSTARLNANSYIHSLAENVVALVFLPKLAEQDRRGDKNKLELAPEYDYDTRPSKDGKAIPQKDLSGFQRSQFNQLPPIVQVVMVAIDEGSAMRYAAISEDAPNWTSGLFEKVNTESDLQDDLGDPQNPEPNSLIGRLVNSGNDPGVPKMNYRIYSTDVVIRGAKWTTKD